MPIHSRSPKILLSAFMICEVACIDTLVYMVITKKEIEKIEKDRD